MHTISMTQAERERLYAEARDFVLTQDPAPILDALGIDYKAYKGGTSYAFRVRETDKTPSARLSLLRNGTWGFIDFGEGQKADSVIGLIMRFNGGDFNSAIKFALEKLSAPQDLINIFDEKKRDSATRFDPASIAEKISKIKEAAKQANIRNRERANPTKRIEKLEILDAQKNYFAKKLMANRGFGFIPTGFKYFKGVQVWPDGGKSNFYGIGVPIYDKNTGEIVAADIHYQRKIGNLKSIVVENPNAKTVSAERWDISFIERDPSSPILVFESKMDYAAVWNQAPSKIDKANIIISNSVSNFEKAAEKISDILSKRQEDKNGQPTIVFFNQADAPGYGLVKNIVDQLEERRAIPKDFNFYILKYKILHEYKKDPNDLLSDRVNIFKRLTMENKKGIKEKIRWINRHESELKKLGVASLIRGKDQRTFIFENMDDYTAVQSVPTLRPLLDRSNIIIATFPSQHKEIAEVIEGNDLDRGRLAFMTGNDLSGRRLATATVNELKGWKSRENEFFLLDYAPLEKAKGYSGGLLTPTDLVKNNIPILKMLKRTTQDETLKKMSWLKIDYSTRSNNDTLSAEDKKKQEEELKKKDIRIPDAPGVEKQSNPKVKVPSA